MIKTPITQPSIHTMVNGTLKLTVLIINNKDKMAITVKLKKTNKIMQLILN